VSLQGIHILLVEDDEETRRQVRNELEQAGAIIHEACSRTKALGLYFELVADDIIPRAVVTDWFLHSPDSAEYRFYKLIDRPVDNTAQHLIERIRHIDPHVAIVVHSGYHDDIPTKDLQVCVVQKGEPLHRIIQVIDLHPSVDAQRTYFRQRSGEFRVDPA